MHPNTSPDLITTAEAAVILNVTTGRVRQLCLAGALPGQRYGRDWLIPRDAVEARRKAREEQAA